MKNQDPAGKSLRFADTNQRLLAIFVLAVFCLLIWLAISGQYDAQVNRFASWLSGKYNTLFN